MNVTDWIRRKPREIREADNFTDAIVQLLIERAQNPTDADVSATGALEAASGIIGRAFASASIEGATPMITAALTPDVMTYIGRGLIRAGEVVYALDTSAGALDLIPAHSWDIEGGPNPRTWRYHLQLPGPSGDMAQELPNDGVLHFKYAVNPNRPHVGLSPVSSGSLAAKLSANTNQALADETGMPRGGVLPLPIPPGETTSTLESRIARLRGKILAAETQRGGYGDKDNAPKDDYMVKRIGAMPPAPLVQLRDDADMLLLAVCGVSPSLFMSNSDGTAQREAYRRFLFSTIQPLGAIVQTELRLKMEAPDLAIDWSELRASDIASRARAFKGLIDSGMDMTQAAANSGILVDG